MSKGPEIEAMEANERKWDDRFLDLARFIAQWSKDPSTKVGAVIVDDLRRVVGHGYNGFPRGIDDSPERLADRPLKHALVVHSEVNAILNARGSVEDCTLYCTHQPCAECAKAIIQAGICRVVVADQPEIAGWGDTQKIAWEMLQEAGVDVR
jgi:dCMP deaminase